MKRKFFIPGIIVIALVVALSLTAWRTVAQATTSQPIILNDSMPNVDIVITPTGGAQGVVYLELDGVHVQVLDTAKNEILSMVDARVQGLAIQIAQGAPSATLHLERLPGVSVAQAVVSAQASMPVVTLAPATTLNVSSTSKSGSTVNTANAVNTANTVNTATTAQNVLTGPTSIKVMAAPAVNVPFMIANSADMLTAPLLAQESTVQLVDGSGAVLLTSMTGVQINALAIRLVPGQYSFNMTNHDLNAQSEITLALSQGPATTLTAANQAASTVGGNVAANASTCSATVKLASANVRSGPGTAYTVLGWVEQNRVLPVGGINRQGGWLLAQTPAGPAWISLTTVTQAGNCDSVRKFDIPLRNGVRAQPTQQPAAAAPAQPDAPAPAAWSAPSSGGGSSSGGGGGGSQPSGGQHHDDGHDSHNSGGHGGDD